MHLSQYFLILFIILFVQISNLPSLIKVNSFVPYYITTDEVLFQFEYNSEEKTDIICFFEPYVNEIIFGEMKLYNNSIDEEIYYNKTFYFAKKGYIVVNSKNNYNIGKGTYYIYLKGNLQCSFEIFLLNEDRNLDTNNSYLFKSLFNYESQNYYSLKIKNLSQNIYMNIIIDNSNCSSLEILKNGNKLLCDKEIPNLLLLEKDKEYDMKYNLDIYNFLKINFINTDLILSLDDNSKSHSLYISNNAIFNFSLEIKNNRPIDFFGFLIDPPIKFSFEGNCAEKKSLDNFISKVNKTGNYFFIEQKESSDDNYFIFKMKFLDDNYNKITIRKIDKIIFIERIPFKYNIQKEKIYLLTFEQELINSINKYNSFIEIKYSNENSMNIIFNNYNFENYNDKIFITKISSIEGISFINLSQEGTIEIELLSENYNQLINSNIFFSGSETTLVYTNNIGEKIEFITNDNNKIFCNLILGDVNFYEKNGLTERINGKKFDSGIIKSIKNQTLLIKSMINSYSLYEIFIQKNEDKIHCIEANSKILYFSKYIKYTIKPISNKAGITERIGFILQSSV